jgi:hypothetical protein
MCLGRVVRILLDALVACQLIETACQTSSYQLGYDPV